MKCSWVSFQFLETIIQHRKVNTLSEISNAFMLKQCSSVSFACFKLTFEFKMIGWQSLFQRKELDSLLRARAGEGFGCNPCPVTEAFPVRLKLPFSVTVSAPSGAGTALTAWRNTRGKCGSSRLAERQLRQSKKRIQKEQHFAWDWNGYTQSATNMLREKIPKKTVPRPLLWNKTPKMLKMFFCICGFYWIWCGRMSRNVSDISLLRSGTWTDELKCISYMSAGKSLQDILTEVSTTAAKR